MFALAMLRMADALPVSSVLSPNRRRPSGTRHLSSKAGALCLLALLSVPCAAQQRVMPGGPRNNFHNPSNRFSWERGNGFHGGFGNVWVVEREVPVIVEREVVREVPVTAQPVAPPSPRKPYVIGNNYASLPGGCMKMIEDGVSYYYCDGEWYRQVGGGRSPTYQAVARKL